MSLSSNFTHLGFFFLFWQTKEKLLLLAIAPFTNLRELIRRHPNDAKHIDVVAMGGSIFTCYGGGFVFVLSCL